MGLDEDSGQQSPKGLPTSILKEKMKLNRIAYNYNKKIWHLLFNGELHHIYNHQDVSLCCLHLFVPAKPGHQDNWEWVGMLRDKFREDYLKALKNWHKIFGCKEQLFKECEKCYFFKYREK